jgi:hypothetical protein
MGVKYKLMKFLVQSKKLTPGQKMARRIGYMGAGFLLAAHWTLEPKLYIAGFCCILVQVTARKQWNLVALNINGLVAWTKHFIG